MPKTRQYKKVPFTKDKKVIMMVPSMGNGEMVPVILQKKIAKALQSKKLKKRK